MAVHMKEQFKSVRQRPSQDTGAAKHGAVVRCAADLKPQKLARVWSGRFFRGKVGFIAGEPGLGKSTVAIFMAATQSNGGVWPGDGKAHRADVIYISAEDGAADTIRPRLEAAGANLRRIHIVDEVNGPLGSRPFSVLTDLGQLEIILQSVRRPRLVIIDPINACLEPTATFPFNPNNVTHVRALLGRLEALARKYHVAIVCVTHFTKAKGGTTLSRVTGSFAFVAAASSVYTVERKKDDPDQRVFAPAKNNLGRDVDALAFHIRERITTGKIPAPYAVFVSS
jgi:putative DNA primase/helicase